MKVTGTLHPRGSVAWRSYLRGKSVIAIARNRSADGRLVDSWWFHCGFCPTHERIRAGFASWRAAYDAADTHLAEHRTEWAEVWP